MSNKYTARRNYFLELAGNDSSLLNNWDITEDGITRKRKSFIQVSADVDSLNAGVINGLDFPFVIQSAFSGSLSDQNGDIRNRYQNRLQFLTKGFSQAGLVELEDAIHYAYDITYSIMKKWMARFYDDQQTLCPCPFNLDFSSFSWAMIGPIADQFYGWELQFSDDERAEDIINGSVGF
jgi:hypothetical protein